MPRKQWFTGTLGGLLAIPLLATTPRVSPCTVALSDLVVDREARSLFSLVGYETQEFRLPGVVKWRPLTDLMPAPWIQEDPVHGRIIINKHGPFMASDGFTYVEPAFASDYDFSVLEGAAGRYVFVREARYTRPGSFITAHVTGPVINRRSDADLVGAAFRTPAFTWPPVPDSLPMAKQMGAKASDSAYALLDVIGTSGGPMWVVPQ